MRHPALRVLLVGVLVVALAAGGGFAAGGSPLPATTSQAGPSGPSAIDGGVSEVDIGSLVAEFDPAPETAIRIDLQSDRTSEWTVVVRYELTDANETAAFESVGDRFVAGEVGPSATLFEQFAAEASRSTDREMRIENVERTAPVHEDPTEVGVEDDDVVAVGELRLTFTWTAFLEQDGENLVLGDALTTSPEDTWLRSLEDGQSVEIATPEGYTVTGTPGASVSLRDNAVIIEGPRVFEGDERVAVVYSPSPAPATPPWTMLAGAIVLAALLIALGLLGYRRIGTGGERAGGSATAPDAAGNGDEASTGAATAGAGAVASDGVAGDADGGEEEPEEDLSLLSDEERVERLLERQGGRMRQADIVGETGWSDAKVSQLLSAMAEEGRVEKLRLGRENLISLPDDDGSPDGDGPS